MASIRHKDIGIVYHDGLIRRARTLFYIDGETIKSDYEWTEATSDPMQGRIAADTAVLAEYGLTVDETWRRFTMYDDELELGEQDRQARGGSTRGKELGSG